MTREHAIAITLADRIDAILPQTQCRKCGYHGCRPYAHAIIDGEADINQCPPGGEAVIRELAAVLGRKPKPLSAAHGVEKPRAVAFIDENLCIGCTLCIQACPVDAIVGAAKQMHTVAAQLCTGCELCIAPCPVDCIWMDPLREVAGTRTREDAKAEAGAARERFEFRNFRLERDAQEKAQRLATKLRAAGIDANDSVGINEDAASQQPPKALTEDRKKALIAAAIERARAQRARIKPRNTGGR